MSVPLEIDCKSVQQKRESGVPFLFLDCREPHEAEVARIEGTVLIPMSVLADRIGELDPYKSSEIVVHCHHGGRSLRVTHFLRSHGFDQAMNMSGGIDEWSTVVDPGVPRY